ncbi:MAG: LVIVD repeat-containing protein, partial [Mycobacteriales bacterium]
CGAGSHPETAAQGRVPAIDYANGGAARGYDCNAALVGHFGTSPGFKVLRYARGGHAACAYIDAGTSDPQNGLGVQVLDMKDPAHPVHTDTLSTPAMVSPHESLLLNEKRGLLVADMGNAVTGPGFVDVYDLTEDCRHPVLQSSLPLGVMGHESAFAPDGKTFYVTSSGGSTMAAVDLSDPKSPMLVAVAYGRLFHGGRVSHDGNYLYVADQGAPKPGGVPNAGVFDDKPYLDVYDVSSIQKRLPNASFKLVGRVGWPNASIPQVPVPMTIRGHHYVLEVDEFAGTQAQFAPTYVPSNNVGAARIINVDSPKDPYVVSNIRLEVNQLRARTGPQQNDPGAADTLGGYAAHYCSVPREVDPGIVTCSFLLSGQRLFNVEDPAHPREVAYFNHPPSGGNSAKTQAAWDLQRHEIWFGDGSGLWVVRLTNGAWPRRL